MYHIITRTGTINFALQQSILSSNACVKIENLFGASTLLQIPRMTIVSLGRIVFHKSFCILQYAELRFGLMAPKSTISHGRLFLLSCVYFCTGY